MAATAQATRLTLAHHRAQAKLGDQTITGLRKVWPTLDLNDLDGTFDAWFELAAPIVRAQRVTSARLAGNYLGIYRKLELGNAAKPIVPTLAETINATQLATSLRVTGPVSIKANVGKGMDLTKAAEIGNERSSKAGQRYALGGGRDTIVQAANGAQDLGWTWVTGGDKPCDYCSNLDGVLFYLGETEFNPHDGCECSAEPTFFDRANPKGA